MDIREICRHVDHTLLSPTATREDIRVLCDEAIEWETASVCIPPSLVSYAREYVGERMRVCSAIGFPLGYSTTAVKEFEALDAVGKGADEVDMVINLGLVKEGSFDRVGEEIGRIREAVGTHILKVIIETCLLTDEEKIAMCRVVSRAGADFIKTSTGFSTGGASFHDIELIRENISPGVRIKASGGISSLEDAVRFIELGAERIGSSRIVRLAKEAMLPD